MNKITQYVALAFLMGSLTACQTTGTDNTANTSQRIDDAVEKAAIKAAKNGNEGASLIVLEKQYKKNSEDPAAALAYAKALRRGGYIDRAAAIIAPFNKGKEVFAGIKSEASTLDLALGNYDSAERNAKAAVMQNPEDYNAYQNLGIALDAKEMHPEAERAFRKGLEHWEGDPTSIMNNLALNLATQGFVDEAIEILERAKELAPDRIEIERNLRIIRTINER